MCGGTAVNYFFNKFKKQLGRIGAAVSVFGVYAVVLAYFFGYFDLSFLDRYKLLDDTIPEKNDTGFSDIFDFSPSGESGNYGEKETETGSEENPPETSGVTLPGEDIGETDSVLAVYDTSDLADILLSYPLAVNLKDYSITDNAYDSKTMELAKMSFRYKLPEKFSFRRRVAEEVSYAVPEEDGEYIAEYKKVREPRPAVELYMGYILIDNQRTLYLIDSSGTPLCSFDDGVYAPAYTRDLSGRPLFVKENAGEKGEDVYYYLSEDGKNFIKSDYNDKTDSRGLYFDYPAYWGAGDNSEIAKSYDEKSEKWGYIYTKDDAKLTGYNFAGAFNFSGGLACVVSDKNRGGMYFIDESGRQIQRTFVTYLSQYNRYVIWDYAMPASRGAESLGFFYYDHGLTRVRYQIIDNWNWSMYRRVRVVSDNDTLIRADGSIYNLPVGYTLKGYSDGMILLERDGSYGFMDYTGSWIAEPCYKSASPFVSGLSVLETEDGRYGMIDTSGNIVLTFTYDYISQPSSGLVAAYREENGWTIFAVMQK